MIAMDMTPPELSICISGPKIPGNRVPEHFQQKCEAVLRPDNASSKELELFRVSEKSGNALADKLLSRKG
ncbi:hypothetical protein CFBP5473_01795 [Agrobacterium larrymoorei]|uniref:Uncharacterized protein n=1 Tax=Agrobacterium larrymoorei TaxID=160699 RepID=A0A4D7DLI1_9HYPH|nr:hypothetical protein CFBP5473_01795 [Agrobacterium larrymoorei]